MSERGRLRIVGLGPGGKDWVTPEASGWIASATDVIGYAPYLDRISLREGQKRHASGNRAEMERARNALQLAEEGRQVALVSGGDPGVFAMAAAVFEAIDNGKPGWRALDIAVSPGISAMQAVAARAGAPLGHDFCAISLSDNLKPWPLIEKRLSAAASADFVIALYNPASAARPRRIHDAFALLRNLKRAATPVIFAHAAGQADEYILIETLATADPCRADMGTLIIIGSSATRVIARGIGTPFVYTSRRAD
ncbi:MAG: precorrin-3B C(17)-methyltransferase [Methylocapsa sp.]|nr:precorrin-3B C(17)-methyltransferase [Methylocapsa sp.]